MEARVPGLGGVWVSSDGRPVVYLKDLNASEQALRELRDYSATMQQFGPFRTKLGVKGSTDIRQGQFSFSELVAWSTTISASVRVPGFISIDADESRNRVRIAISVGAPREPFIEALHSLGIPESAVTLEESALPITAASLTDRVRPTGSGLSISVAGSGCSIGFNVRMLFYAEDGFLTASHCSGSFSGGTGQTTYQNSSGGSNTVGIVSLNPAWNQTVADCRSATLCTDADAMYVHSSDSTSANFSKRIYYSTTWGTNDNSGNLTIYNSPYTGISVLGYTYVGMTAYKVGSTTGVTYGTVSSTCENPMFDSTSVPKVVLCVNRVDGAAYGGGDSGGAVFYPPVSPDPPYAIGIMFGGYASTLTSGKCTAGCSIFFSEWYSVSAHLGRYFSP